MYKLNNYLSSPLNLPLDFHIVMFSTVIYSGSTEKAKIKVILVFQIWKKTCKVRKKTNYNLLH